MIGDIVAFVQTIAVWLLLFAALLVSGKTDAELPPASTLLLAAAPLTPWVGRAELLRRLRPWKVFIVQLAAGALPVAFALAIPIVAFSSSIYG